jgi:hypothetical protein
MKNKFSVRPAFSLLFWPFAFPLGVAVLVYGTSAGTVWERMYRACFAFSMFFYPLAYFYGLLLSRSNSETWRLRAPFWLNLPWKVLGFWVLFFVVLACFGR